MQCSPRSRFERISFSNLVMRNVTGPISIGVGPSGRSGHHPGGQSLPAGSSTNGMAQAAAPAGSSASTNAPSGFALVPDPEESSEKPGICRNISFNGIFALVSKPYQIPDVAVTGTYNPGEIFSCIALNGVAPGYLEDIRFNDVHVIFPGGGTVEQGANRNVPQIADKYFRNGILPSYALFARGVHGLTLNNVRFEMTAPDLRPAIIFDHVTDAAVTGLNVQGQKDAESVLRFIESQDVFMSATRLLTPATTFLQMEGQNANITLDGGDLSKAAGPVAYKYGATPDAVKLRV
jgi:hypothetical protein